MRKVFSNNFVIYFPWDCSDQCPVRWLVLRQKSMLLLRQCTTASPSMYSVIQLLSVPLFLSLFLSWSITFSLLHPSLPRRPLRGRFYSVWISCPSWRGACWWGENLFLPVEPWFKALRSTRFWVIVSPVVMNQGRGRQQTACRQKQGVGELQNWPAAFRTEPRSIYVSVPKCNLIFHSWISSTQLISTQTTSAYARISCLLDACEYADSNLAGNLCFSARTDPAGPSDQHVSDQHINHCSTTLLALQSC